MIKPCLIRLFVALISLVPVAVTAAGPMKITASLDSAYILMGKQTTLHLELVQDKGMQGAFLNHNSDTLTSTVVIAKALKPDTTDIGNNREEIKREIVIQSFDSGLYTIPPFIYAAGNETIASNPLTLKVLPVPVDTLATIHDYAGVAKPNTKLIDYLPDFIVDYWWIYLLVIAVAVIVFIIVMLRKRNVKDIIMPKKKPIPPYQMAIQQLNKLKGEKLWENGHEKEYYTRLTEILRIYLDRRFGINAMEMTSSQIMSHIRDNETTKPSVPMMRQILEIADFVKFAKVRPLPDDNAKAFSNAMQFVESTKPEEPAEEETKKETSSDKKDNK